MNLRQLCISFALYWTSTSFAIHPDSINHHLKDYQYLTRFTEANLATYPYIHKMYGKEYAKLKKSIKRHLLKGQDIETATCDYVFWFFSQFDTHFIVDRHRFWQEYDRRIHPRYNEKMEYDPQPLACMLDTDTYLVRIPSCSGQNPTYAWVDSVAQAYKRTNCPYLILDIRGNSGGNDAIWEPFLEILADHQPKKPWRVLFRNTPMNREVLMKQGDTNIVEKARQSKAQFVPLSEENNNEEMPFIASHLKKAAILVDSRTASSGETLARFVKDYCHRGKIYGQDPTSGANLSGNIAPFQLPHSGITCYYPVCVDEDFALQIKTKEIGIKPDIKIPLPLPASLKDHIDTWVVWVAKSLKSD